jgi:hypothetical protein
LKKSILIAALVAAVTAELDADYEICIKSLALAKGTSVGTIFSILQKVFGLIMKNGSWVPKVL